MATGGRVTDSHHGSSRGFRPAAIVCVGWFLLAIVAGSALYFAAATVHWPLVGDSAQIHYICFLMDRGMAPYRVAGDMNMPGALLLEWAVMHTLGSGSPAWRCFDLGLLGAAVAAMAGLCGRGYRLAGLGAGLLFALLHGADGLNDTGERDLSMAVFLLLAYWALFALLRRAPDGRGAGRLSFGFGFFAAATASIKPTVLLLVVCLGAAWIARAVRRSPGKQAAMGVVGFALPFAGALALLWQQRAVDAFFHGLHTAVPYYASLQRQGWGYLLVHSVAPLLPVVCCWALGPAWMRSWSLERGLLLLGAAFGLASYLAQGKGFPYYRYPLLAFLLPLMAADCVGCFRERKRRLAPAVLAGLSLVYAAAWIAPLSAYKTHGYRWRDQQFLGSLTRDLQALGARDGEVQCIDSISGCGNALLRLRLVQSTGLLSDFFIFGPAEARAVREARAGFQAAVAREGEPRYIVVTDGLHLHPRDPGHWGKVEEWPWFAEWLRNDYTPVLTRYPTRPALWWSRPGMPAAYRVYVRDRDAGWARARLARNEGLRGTDGEPLVLAEP